MFWSPHTCTPIFNGSVVINNQDTTGSITVTKTFNNLPVGTLPEGFQIIASWTDPSATVNSSESSGEIGAEAVGTKSVVLMTTGDATGNTEGLTITRTEEPAVAASGDATATPASYTWTITGLPVNTVVTFTEANYSVAGYTWTGTVVNGDGSTSSNPIEGTGTVTAEGGQVVAFTNTYTPGVELPATGGHGTAIYMVAGLMLITLAGVLMIGRKRKYNR